MRLIHGWHNLRPEHRGCVATIGNFDGVHRGHQAVLARLRQLAAGLAAPPVLITFEPHPLEFLRPELAPPRLTGLRDKLAALAEEGLARVLCLRFDHRLAEMEPEDFVRDLLLTRLGVRQLLVGDDFRFGRQRRGDFAMLAGQPALGVERLPTVAVGGERVSSTRVRTALAAGDLGLAEELLGRPFAISGRVVRGDAIGRTLGYPTANLAFRRHKPPLAGIFVVEVAGLGGWRPAVASVGTRPTVNGRSTLLEVHLLDFQDDLYGRHLTVRFLKRLRSEERFPSLDALRAQMARDEQAARNFFAAAPTGGASLTG